MRGRIVLERLKTLNGIGDAPWEAIPHPSVPAATSNVHNELESSRELRDNSPYDGGARVWPDPEEGTLEVDPTSNVFLQLAALSSVRRLSFEVWASLKMLSWIAHCALWSWRGACSPSRRK